MKRRSSPFLLKLAVFGFVGALLSSPMAAQNEGWKNAERLFDLSARPVEALEALAAKTPKDPWAHYFHGRALAESKRLREAEVALERAAQLAPEEGFVVGERAEVVSRQGDLRRAEELFGRARSRSRDEAQRDHFRDRAQRSAEVSDQSATRVSSLLAAIAGALLTLVTAFVMTLRRLK